MKLFLDTADIEEIREINRWGVLSGVTTNPSLVAREGQDPDVVWKEILETVPGDISLETTATEADAMYEEGLVLAQKAPNAVVKVPMTAEGLACGKRLVNDGIKVNVTLVFSPAQAILAAEIGAYIVSPFLGRLDDVGADGMGTLRAITEIYAVQGYDTNVLAASLRFSERAGNRSYIRSIRRSKSASSLRYTNASPTGNRLKASEICHSVSAWPSSR